MCNLYSMTKTRDELVGLFDVRRDAPQESFELPAIYPDQMAPTVRLDEDGARELTLMRWGFPPPPKVATRPVTNVRNVQSSFWRH
jgi:putative SOS response-associated peptidase YedK